MFGDCVHMYYLIDASFPEGVEGEENFEEEEYFDQFASQGKLSYDTLIDPCFYHACFAKLTFA